MEVPPKTKRRVALMFQQSHFWAYHRGKKSIIRKDKCTPIFTAALFTRVMTWKQPKCPLTEGWIKEMWYIYV